MKKPLNLFRESTTYFLLTGVSLLLVFLCLFILGITTIQREQNQTLDHTLEFIGVKLNDSFNEVRFRLDRISQNEYINFLFLYDDMDAAEKNTLYNQLVLILENTFSPGNYAMITSAGIGFSDASFFLCLNEGIGTETLSIFPAQESGLIFSDELNSFFAYRRMRNEERGREIITFIELKKYNVEAYLNSLLPFIEGQSVTLIHPQTTINAPAASDAKARTFAQDLSCYDLSFLYTVRESGALLSLRIFIIIGICAILLYFAIIVLYLCVYHKKISRPYQKLLYDQKVLALEANVKYLEAQISPHFLYNCLYSINLLAKCGKMREVCEFSTKLGTFYKYTAKKFADNVTLRDEYECVRNYCEIQTLRFGQRIRVSLSPPSEAIADCSVPKFSIQALVENAYTHGMKNMEEGGIIRIGFLQDEEHIDICVEDNGDSLSDETLSALQKRLDSGEYDEKETGIANLNMRLRLKFAGRAALFLRRSELGGLAATIRIFAPKQTNGTETKNET